MPLADIPSESLCGQARPSLERLRLQAVEWRVEADLRLGRHANLVLELQALTAEHPLRERFHAQLMLALYRSGRAAEALAAFEAARRTLAEQLGVNPGPDLRRLHERILRSDTGLAFAALNQDFAIQIELETFGVLAGITIVDAHAESVVSGIRRREGSLPANGIVVAMEAVNRDHFVPVEVDIAVISHQDRRAAQIF